MAHRPSEPLIGSPCHRWTARRSRRSLRQAPRFGRARSRASPGIRVSRSGLRRRISNKPCCGKEKPSGASGSGGLAIPANCRYRLCEIAPMSRACAIEWQIAIRQPDKFFAPVLHRTTHVRSRTPRPRRARWICSGFRNVNSTQGQKSNTSANSSIAARRCASGAPEKSFSIRLPACKDFMGANRGIT
jgi:hypothetical protein